MDKQAELQDVHSNINWRYMGLIFIVLILWASSYVGIRHSLEVFSAENLAFLRYLVASAGFIIVTFFLKIRMPSLSDIPGILLLGFTGFALYNLLLNSGERTVNASIASFIINTVPFFTTLFVIIRREEKITRVDLSGMLIAFAGVFVIIFTSTNGATIDYNALYILIAAVCQALYFALQKKFLKKYSPIELTGYAVWSGTVMMFFFSEKSFQSLIQADRSHIFSVIYLGLFPGMLAYLIIAYALKAYKTTNVSSYLFLIPFITLLLGWILLKEIPSLWALSGGLLIVSGILTKNRVIPAHRET